MGWYARYPIAFVVLLIPLLLVSACYSNNSSTRYPKPLPLQAAGLLGDGIGPVAIVSPEEAGGASFVPGSNVLRLRNGDLRYLPVGETEPTRVSVDDPGAGSAVAASREWLSSGTIPGKKESHRAAAERALLDLRLLTGEGGATLAGPTSRWRYVWPRDASFAAVAFAATGHHEEAGEIFTFLASIQEEDGGWEARYHRSGQFVSDGRTTQLDATGWFLWATWYAHVTDPEPDRADARTAKLWPAIASAADKAAGSLNADGLPPGGPDYWEIRTWRPNLGTAAPLETGLRSAAALAHETDHKPEAHGYARSARRLDGAIERRFAPYGYPRTTRLGSGADAAVNFLAPPFAPEEREVRVAIDRAARLLTTPNGGVVPGEDWAQDPEVSWTPETAFFALSAAAAGDEEKADRWLDWILDHRTKLGSLPEKIDGEGEPQAAAPLAWTSALVVLALAAEDETLPVPPGQRLELNLLDFEGISRPDRPGGDHTGADAAPVFQGACHAGFG